MDILIGNESEAASYAESHSLDTKEVKKIAQTLAELPKKNNKKLRTVIITQGTDPTVAAVSKEGGAEVTETKVHAIGKEQINDTNGAGYVS